MKKSMAHDKKLTRNNMTDFNEENPKKSTLSFRENYERYKKSSGKALFYLFLWLDFKDPITWSLLISNLVTIVFALAEHWSVINVLIVFWVQCVLIGIFNLLRMLNVSNKAIEDVTVQDPEQPANPGSAIMAKVVFIIFFVMCYWAFLGGTLGGMVSLYFAHKITGEIHIGSIAISALLFAANHAYSYLKNREADKEASISILFFYPFLRIIPMQAITYASLIFPQAALAVFLIAKTFVDLKSYHWERLKYEKPTAEDKKKILEISKSMESH